MVMHNLTIIAVGRLGFKGMTLGRLNNALDFIIEHSTAASARLDPPINSELTLDWIMSFITNKVFTPHHSPLSLISRLPLIFLYFFCIQGSCLATNQRVGRLLIPATETL